MAWRPDCRCTEEYHWNGQPKEDFLPPQIHWSSDCPHFGKWEDYDFGKSANGTHWTGFMTWDQWINGKGLR